MGIHPEHIDRALDAALGMTFPASDPVAISIHVVRQSAATGRADPSGTSRQTRGPRDTTSEPPLDGAQAACVDLQQEPASLRVELD